MPQNVKMEEAVLGAVLLDNKVMPLVNIILNSGDFYKDANNMVYDACLDLYSQNKPVDLLSVSERLLARGELQRAGDVDYLMELTSKIASSSNVEYHAKVIKDLSMKRKLIQANTQSLSRAFSNEFDYDNLRSELDLELLNIEKDRKADGQKSNFEIIKEMEADRVRVKGSGLAGIAFTGISELDGRLDGAEEGDLIIIAARPGMGKSAMGITCLANLMDTDKQVAYWSLEMLSKKNMRRLVACRGEVSFTSLKRGDLSALEQLAYNTTVQEIKEKDNITFIETPGVNVMEIRSKVTTLAKKGKCDILFIDHGSLIKHVPGRGTDDAKIGITTSTLKNLAKELRIPIIVFWQLNRESEKTSNKIPTLIHLRGSGNIEQDADKIIFIFRPEMYMLDSELDGHETTTPRGKLKTRGLTMFNMAKIRDGIPGVAIGYFQGDYQKFSDYKKEWIGKAKTQED